jgi:hypothetical protein
MLSFETIDLSKSGNADFSTSPLVHAAGMSVQSVTVVETAPVDSLKYDA